MLKQQTHCRFRRRMATSPRRSAVTLLEVVTASTVLAIVFATLVPVLASLRADAFQKEVDVLAVDQVSNVLERVLADHNAGQFDESSLDQLTSRSELQSYLGNTVWSGSIEPIAEPAGRRVTVTLLYGTSHQREVTLSAWLWEEASE